MKWVSFFLMVVIFISGCGTANKWTPEERLWIDRGLGLPEGVRSWKNQFVFGVDQEFGRSQDSSYYFYPFTWEHGLSQQWTLVWSPFPLDIKYNAHESGEVGSRSRLDFQFSFLGNGYSNAKTFLWRPAVFSSFKKSYEGIWGLELRAFIQPELGRSLAENFALTVGLEPGVIHQFSDQFAAKIFIAFQGEMKAPGSQYLKNAPSEFSRDLKWRYPLGLALQASLSESWEFQAEYRWYRLGYLNNFEAHQWITTTAMYW